MEIEIELSNEEISLLKKWDTYMEDDNWHRLKEMKAKYGNIEMDMDEFLLKLKDRMVEAARKIK